MINSLFSYIKGDIDDNYRIKNLKEKLKETGALKKFEEIYADYGANADKVVTYLIFAYASDSTFVSAGEDWLSTQKAIMDMLKMNPEEYVSVLKLEKQSVKTAILYLTKEFKDWRYQQIITWKESCKILDSIATTTPDSRNRSGAKNLGDANKFSYEIKKKIADLEKEIMQQTKHQERYKQVSELNIENLSMEKLLKEITKS